jgi:hypothetical protein
MEETFHGVSFSKGIWFRSRKQTRPPEEFFFRLSSLDPKNFPACEGNA